MNFQEEFEKLLEAEWEGRLDATGRMRLDVLCQEHPDFLKKLEGERKITRLLRQIGPSQAPGDLAENILRRISSERTSETTETQEIESVVDTDPSQETKVTVSWKKYKPCVQWVGAAALLAFIFVHGGSIIHDDDGKQEVTEKGGEVVTHSPSVPFDAIPLDRGHSMNQGENRPENMSQQEPGTMIARSLPDAGMKADDHKQQKRGVRVVAKLKYNPGVGDKTGMDASSTSNRVIQPLPTAVVHEEDAVIGDYTEKPVVRTNLAMAGDTDSGDGPGTKQRAEIRALEWGEPDLGLTLYVFSFPHSPTLKTNSKIPTVLKNPEVFGNASVEKEPGQRTPPTRINTLLDKKRSTRIIPGNSLSKKQEQPFSLDGQDEGSPLQNIRDLAKRHSGEIESMERIHSEGRKVWRLDLAITCLNLTNLLEQLVFHANPSTIGVPPEDRKPRAGKHPPLSSYTHDMYGYLMEEGLSKNPFPHSDGSGSMSISREALTQSGRYRGGDKLKIRVFVIPD